MKKLWCFAVLAAIAGSAAANREPTLDWTVQRIGADGGIQAQGARQSSFDATQLQMRVLCDREQAARMNWPETSAVRVTVRPFMAKPDDGRMRTADITCDEVRSSKSVLERHIPRDLPPLDVPVPS